MGSPAVSAAQRGGPRHEPQGNRLGHPAARAEACHQDLLWFLCDRRNPDFGCFPTQAQLAHDCEISHSTLNAYLDQLEAAKLLRPLPRLDPVTKRQMPTRYILGFEEGFTPHDPKPCQETGHGVLAIGYDAESARENPTVAPEDAA